MSEYECMSEVQPRSFSRIDFNGWAILKLARTFFAAAGGKSKPP
jgi:hypothetical protein